MHPKKKKKIINY